MQKHPPKEVAAATPGQVLAPGAPGTGTTAEEAVLPDTTFAPDTTGAAPSAEAPRPPLPTRPAGDKTGRATVPAAAPDTPRCSADRPTPRPAVSAPSTRHTRPTKHGRGGTGSGS